MYAGDAVQKLLPRDFRVPYIGWHPVEDKMTPRNLYDHTKVTINNDDDEDSSNTIYR